MSTQTAAVDELLHLLSGLAVIGELVTDLLDQGAPIEMVLPILLNELAALVARVDMGGELR